MPSEPFEPTQPIPAKHRTLSLHIHFEPEHPRFVIQSQRTIWHRGEPFTTDGESRSAGLLWGWTDLSEVVAREVLAFYGDVTRQ
jgi:hypothetical protein